MHEENIAKEEAKTTLGHPTGLFYLFFAELWERFSFYGMRALLTLYMVNQIFEALANRDHIAAVIYASYGSMVYASTVVGGHIADKLLGYRMSILLGGVLMAIGHFVMAIDHTIAFFTALSFLIVGNGFFKPNISTFVGTLYKKGDKRKDAGFSIFYMGINIGAFVSPLACGYLGQAFGWHYGFGLAGVGMLIGLIVFGRGLAKGIFHDKGLPSDPEYTFKKIYGLTRRSWAIVGSFLSVPLVALMLSSYQHIAGGNSFFGETTLVELLFKFLGVVIVVYILYILKQATPKERRQLGAAFFLTLGMTMFWGFFELQGSTLTLFAERNVNLWLINASQTNSIDPFFIIILAVPMSMLWVRLSKTGHNPRSPNKFALGLLWLSACFAFLYASQFFADTSGKVPFLFLVGAYFLIAVGELFMSPIGLSKITDLSPLRMASFMMGVWFLSSAYAFQIVGFIAKALAIKGSASTEASAKASLAIYTQGFGHIALIALGVSVVFFALAPLIKRWMQEIH